MSGIYLKRLPFIVNSNFEKELEITRS